MTDQEITARFVDRFFRRWGLEKHEWFGVPIIKYPSDLMTYQILVSRTKPEILIETGAYCGGSALFFAHLFDILGRGRVISVDLHERPRPQHPRITYVIGRSTAVDTLAKVRELAAGDTGMVCLDSDHRRPHVKRELARYWPFVAVNKYLVVEDTWRDAGPDRRTGAKPGKTGAGEAVDWFIARRKDFVRTTDDERFLLSLNRGGYLKRVA